jgi:hypothetical protein
MITNRLEALTRRTAPTPVSAPVPEEIPMAMAVDTKMLAKVFWGYQDKQLEKALQDWFDENPGIRIHSVTQSPNEPFITVIIVYSK